MVTSHATHTVPTPQTNPADGGVAFTINVSSVAGAIHHQRQTTLTRGISRKRSRDFCRSRYRFHRRLSAGLFFFFFLS